MCSVQLLRTDYFLLLAGFIIRFSLKHSLSKVPKSTQRGMSVHMRQLGEKDFLNSHILDSTFVFVA